MGSIGTAPHSCSSFSERRSAPGAFKMSTVCVWGRGRGGGTGVSVCVGGEGEERG